MSLEAMSNKHPKEVLPIALARGVISQNVDTVINFHMSPKCAIGSQTAPDAGVEGAFLIQGGTTLGIPPLSLLNHLLGHLWGGLPLRYPGNRPESVKTLQLASIFRGAIGSRSAPGPGLEGAFLI